jgi:hypothetical protein
MVPGDRCADRQDISASETAGVPMVEVHQLARAGGYGQRLLRSGLTLVGAPRFVGCLSTGAREP